MSRRLLTSIMLIAIVAVLAIGGTFAYFSATAQTTATINAAKIGLVVTPSTWTLNKMLPGDTQTQSYAIANSGNVDADLWMKVSADNLGGFCTGSMKPLTVKVTAGTSVILAPTDLCNYADSKGSWFKVDTLTAGTSGTATAHITMDTAAGNEFNNMQGGSVTVAFVETQVNITPEQSGY